MNNTPGLWDAIWRHGFPDWDELSEEICSTLRREIGPLDGKRILEAGSGTGRISCALACSGADVYLADYSEEALAMSREHFLAHSASGHFVLTDIRNLQLPDDYFDVVWSSGVLEHFGAYEQRIILNEMVRVSKNGAKIIVIVPYSNSLLYQLGKWWSEALGTWPYGVEEPMLSLGQVLEDTKVRLLREYTIAGEVSADFLRFLGPQGAMLRQLVRLKRRLHPEVEVPGYLLVSVMQVDKTLRAESPGSPDGLLPDTILPDTIMNKPVLFLSSVNWQFLWQRPQQLASRLARLGRRVVYVNAQRMGLAGFDTLPENGAGLNLALASLIAEQSYQAMDNLFVLSPVEQVSDKQGSCRYVLDDFLAQVTRMYELNDYACWVLSPLWAPSLRRLPGRKTIVYDCIDEHGGMADDRRVRELEAELIRQSDIVLVTSKNLLSAKSNSAKQIFYVPNGASRSAFEQAQTGGHVQDATPEDICSIPRPRIGFVGAIAKWVDQKLLRNVALKRPNYSFVFIGPAFVDISALKLPNVFILGAKPYDVLFSYYRQLDVGLIPFIEDDLQAWYSNPIKAYEYIAAGLPVVSTRIPELESLGALVSIASTEDEFCDLIDKAVEGKLRPDRQARERFWEFYDWDKIAGVADRIMKAHDWLMQGEPGEALKCIEAIPEFYHRPKWFARLCRRLLEYKARTGKTIIPLEIPGRLDVLVMAFPDWKALDSRWRSLIEVFVRSCAEGPQATLALRVDPEEVDEHEVFLLVRNLIEGTGLNPEHVSKILLVNDKIDPAELDRLIVTADAVVDTGDARMAPIVRWASDLGCTIVPVSAIEDYIWALS